MKKNIFTLIIILFTLTGCEDFLNKVPVDELSPDTFFQDAGDLSLWNAGLYNAFQKTLHQAQVNWGEIRSDNVHTTGYADDKYYMNALLATMGDFSWENMYNCIALCNTGIERYPTIPSVLETDYAPYMAQAYAMRALMYFYGTRVWGKMPLITESWDGFRESSFVPRSSLEAVKQQIFDDIENALYYFGSSTSSRQYITRAMVYALKTDAHMWYQEYAEALEASEYFIGHADFSLAEGETEWKNIFINPANSPEIIFYMAWNYSENGVNGWAARMGATNTNNGYKMSREIFTEFIHRLYSGKGSDARFWNTIDTVAIYYTGNRVPLSEPHWEQAGVNKNIKYSDVDPNRTYNSSYGIYQSHFVIQSTENCEVQLSIYRLADIMLLRAEALNQLGRKAEALEIVNQIRSRVGYLADVNDELYTGSTEEIETIILKERQLEFIGEGRRWFDLFRTGRLIDTMDPVFRTRQNDAGGIATGFNGEGRKYGPIYYREFEANIALQGDQNDPYAEG